MLLLQLDWLVFVDLMYMCLNIFVIICMLVFAFSLFSSHCAIPTCFLILELESKLATTIDQ